MIGRIPGHFSGSARTVPIGPEGGPSGCEGKRVALSGSMTATIAAVGATNVRVLVVDDAPEVRRLLCHRLPIYGRFEVVAQSEDGEAAIAAARDIQPDLIVLDVLMPGRSGIEVAPDIRQV